MDVSAHVDQTALRDAIAEGLKTIPAPINAAALRQICLLSGQYGFRIKIVLPPVAAEIEDPMIESGKLAELSSTSATVLVTIAMLAR